MDNIVRNKENYPSIYETFEKVAEKTSYYDIIICNSSLWKDDIKSTQINCGMFVEKHYELGRKDECFKFDFQEKYIREGKHAHTVSLYLMGMAFIEKSSTLRDKLTNQLQSFLTYYKDWYVKREDEYNLLYTWYLTAMYHDVASCIERAKIPENPTERQKSLEYYLGELDITYSPYGNFPYRKNNIPQRFSENLIKNYFYYRANNGSCEHGILAGYLFFDRFVRSFSSYTKDGSINDNGMIENLAQEKIRRWDEKRQWNIEQISHAAYVADAIICHNLWMSDNAELYRAYGLSPLLHTEHGENRLSIKKYPIQFMLCLLDTMEPLKRFAKKPYDGDMEPKEVLSHVYLEFGDCGMTVRWDEQIEKNGEIFHKWCDALKGLQSWMEVRCETVGREITISWTGN